MPEHTASAIPTDLLALYLRGQVTAKVAAQKMHVSQSTFLKRLHTLGVDTKKGTYQRRRLALAIEQSHDLPTGTAAATAASLYQSGLSTYEVADQLGCNRLAAWRLLHHEGFP